MTKFFFVCFAIIKNKTTTIIPDGEWKSFSRWGALEQKESRHTILIMNFIIKFENKNSKTKTNKQIIQFQKLTLLPVAVFVNCSCCQHFFSVEWKAKHFLLLTFLFHLELSRAVHFFFFSCCTFPLLVLCPLLGTKMGCWPKRLATALLLILPIVRPEMCVLFMGQIVTRTVKTHSPRCHIASADAKPPHFVPVIRRTPRFHIPVIIFSCPSFMLFLSEWMMHQRRPGTLRCASGRLAVEI